MKSTVHIFVVCMIAMIFTCCRTNKISNNNTLVITPHRDTVAIIPILELGDTAIYSSLDTVIKYLAKCKFTSFRKPYFALIYFFSDPEIMRITSVQDYNDLFDSEFDNKLGCFDYRGNLFVVAKSKNQNSFLPIYFHAKGSRMFTFSSIRSMYYIGDNLLAEDLTIDFSKNNGGYIIKSKQLCGK